MPSKLEKNLKFLFSQFQVIRDKDNDIRDDVQVRPLQHPMTQQTCAAKNYCILDKLSFGVCHI